MMRVAISSGHGKYIRGASGYLDEVDEARKVVEQTADVLRDMGVGVETFHDNTSHDQNTNLNTIVNWHNKQTRDLDISCHFNAYQTTSKPMGTECLFVTQQSLAAKVSEAIADAGDFIDRGPKKRTDLFFLNNTDKPAILIETCFVDSKADADLYNKYFAHICDAIAEAISGIKPPVEETPPLPGLKPPERPVRPERPEPPEIEPPGEERPPSPEPPSQPTLKQGDEGEAVASVQRSLGLPDDGDFGPATDAWVRSFQGACGQSQDGIVGPATWAALDALDAKMRAGDDGISDQLADDIDALVEGSDVDDISWPDRGQAPDGYIAGMAKTFALAVTLYKDGNAAVKIMAQAETGNDDKDALTWYHDEFAEHDMDNSRDGLATLRHLFVMMVGLGMRESSGNHWEGRDQSASNVESDTAEASLFQTSWNISNCSDTIEDLLFEYWVDPNGFRPTFTRGLYPTASQLDCYGTGDGARYQWLSRFSPAFHALVTGVGMRLLRAHWGPIGRKEVDIDSDVDELLVEVQRLVTPPDV
jgi:hypothetical protein